MIPYNNYYQPNYPKTENGIVWVQGIEGAKAYQMMPNSNIQLMDSENDGIFYIKTTDNIGMATLRTFKYSEITPTEHKTDLSEYVKKSELSDLINELLQRKGVNNEQPVSAVKSNKLIQQ